MMLEQRLERLEASNDRVIYAIDRLIAALSNGPVTPAAVRPRRSANANKEAPAPEEPTLPLDEPAQPAQPTREEVLDALSQLPREAAMKIVGKYSANCRFSEIREASYGAILEELSQKEAA